MMFEYLHIDFISLQYIFTVGSLPATDQVNVVGMDLTNIIYTYIYIYIYVMFCLCICQNITF